jgi:hypothetical protein
MRISQRYEDPDSQSLRHLVSDNIPRTLSNFGVYPPVVEAIAESLTHADSDAVRRCVNQLIEIKSGTQTRLTISEMDSLLSYAPVIAPIYDAFVPLHWEMPFLRVARQSLAFTVFHCDVPGDHVLDIREDAEILDAVRGGAMRSCVEVDCPDTDEILWMGQHAAELIPYATIINENKDITIEFCEMIVETARAGASPTLQHGLL